MDKEPTRGRVGGMNFFKRKATTAYRAYLDSEESSEAMHVYKIEGHPELTIFYNLLENHATLTVDLNLDDPQGDEYLSSERFEDWKELESRIPYWTVTLRQIETLYRHDMQDMIHTYEAEE
ncbi:hypothetical protein SEA_C3PO_2 [Corynebacterium phage C3PO]|uniref:Uncharacterized protein n=1 Tax=Corynebacterium phage C3PO TaxID=2047868 RepID=A0A2H4P8F6_9CAUD|nr:hypothetical protein FDJ10_gp02 [Corynebacterium phage C3PO]ATW58506.1 hypothetical protein SEA_C3PO_2 [Corynebacterium phage C3PO]